MQDNKTDKSGLSWVQSIGSVLAAAFGVQSPGNRERDFSQGNFGKFVAVAVGFTLVFLLTLLGIVHLVMKQI